MLSWTEIIELFTIKFCESKNETIENLFSNQYLAQIFHDVVTLTFPSENQLSECIFSTTRISAIDDSLNHLKKSLTFILNMVIVHTLKRTIAVPKSKNTGFFSTLKILTPMMINSVIRLIKSQKINIEDVKYFIFLVYCVNI